MKDRWRTRRGSLRAALRLEFALNPSNPKPIKFESLKFESLKPREFESLKEFERFKV